jgi:hypothetical protein
MSNKLKGVCLFLFCLFSIAMANAQTDGQTATNDTTHTVVKYAPLISPPPLIPQMTTNFSVTNAHDAYEGWLLGAVDDTERKLQQTNLNAGYRQSLEWILKLNQGKLSNHQAQIQRESDFVKAVKSNPRTAWTNMPDPIEEALASDVTKYEGELANTSLAPNTRKTYEAMLDNYNQKLADHETNAQLWANLRLALDSHKQEQLVQAQRQLADYLATRLGKVQGKTYPAGMSLDAILAEYQKQANGSHWSNRQTIIRFFLLAVFLVPPVVMIFVALKKRFSKSR